MLLQFVCWLIQCNIVGQDLVVMLKSVANTSPFLGLESCLSKLTYIQTIKKRRAIVEAVLCKHHCQLSLGANYPNTLANVSAADC